MNLNDGQTLTLLSNGNVFDLLQFHFHTPSEHTVSMRQFDLEMHLVHKLRNGDNLLVLGIFFETVEESKEPNDFLASF